MIIIVIIIIVICAIIAALLIYKRESFIIGTTVSGYSGELDPKSEVLIETTVGAIKAIDPESILSTESNGESVKKLRIYVDMLRKYKNEVNIELDRYSHIDCSDPQVGICGKLQLLSGLFRRTYTRAKNDIIQFCGRSISSFIPNETEATAELNRLKLILV